MTVVSVKPGQLRHEVMKDVGVKRQGTAASNGSTRATSVKRLVITAMLSCG